MTLKEHTFLFAVAFYDTQIFSHNSLLNFDQRFVCHVQRVIVCFDLYHCVHVTCFITVGHAGASDRCR